MNDSLLLTINGWAGRNHLLDGVMIFCAHYLIYIVFAIAAVWFLATIYKRNLRQVGFFLANLIISFILLEIASKLYVDHRPFADFHLTQLISHAAGSSFPSDHTTAATAVALSFLVFTKFKKLGAALILVALLIGFARIFVGVHYPIDIAGGIITALVGVVITYGISITLKKKPHELQGSQE